MGKKRYAGPPIYLAADLSLPIEATVSNGGGSYTTLGTTPAVPYPTIPAGLYSFGEFVILAWQKIRQYLFDDLNAAATLPTIVGTVDDIALTLAWISDQTWGASRLNFSLAISGARIGGNPAPVTACTLKNNTIVSAARGWPTLLGLGVEGTDVACAIGGGVATALGQFQPREIYALLRAEILGARIGVAELSQLLPMSDGTVDDYTINSGFAEQEWTLVDHDATITGNPKLVGMATALDATRLILSCPNPRIAGNVGGVVGISDTGLRGPRLPVGAYVGMAGVGESGWVGRVRQVVLNVPPTPHQILLWERVPQALALSFPTPLYRVPEAWAMRADAKRLKTFLLYEGDDATGAGEWRYAAMALGEVGGSGYRFDNERRSVRADRYTMRFRGVLMSKLPTTPVTT